MQFIRKFDGSVILRHDGVIIEGQYLLKFIYLHYIFSVENMYIVFEFFYKHICTISIILGQALHTLLNCK